MKIEKIDIRGVQVCNVTLEDAVNYIREQLRNDIPTAVYTPNAEIVQLCIDNPSYYSIINSAELIVPDGVGVIKAAKENHPVFLFGGKDASRCETGQSVADQCKDMMEKKYPGLTIVGTKDGYCKKEGPENDKTIEAVNASGASILFVCLGAPLQEKWIWENRSRMPGVKLFLGLGGSLDIYSGNTKRAPKIFIKLGLEWFYRLCCEPWRIKRMMQLPKFYFGTKSYKRKLQKKKSAK